MLSGVFARMARQRLTSRPGRAVLIVLAVAGSVAMAFAVEALNLSQQRGYETIESAFGAVDRQIVARTDAGLPDGVVEKVRELEFVDSAAPASVRFVRVSAADSSARLGLVGLDRSIEAFRPNESLDRIAASRDEDANGLYLPAPVADRLNVGVGDMVRVRAGDLVKPVFVAGLLEKGDAGAAAEIPVAFAPLGLAQSLTGTTGRISRVLVATRGQLSQADEARLGEITGYRADVRPPGTDAKLFASASSLEAQVASLFGAMVLLIGVLLVFNVASLDVAERRNEFVVLRSLGAGNRVVLGRAAGEAAVVGLVGSIIGVALGQLFVGDLAGGGPEYLAGAFLIDPSVDPPGWLVPMCVVAGTAVAIAGAVVPTWMLVRSIDRHGFSEAEAEAGRRSARPIWSGVVALTLVIAGATIAVSSARFAAAGLAVSLAGIGLLLPQMVRGSISLIRSILPRPGGAAAIGVSELAAAPGRATSLAAICALCIGGIVFIGGTSNGLIKGVGETSASMFGAADLWVSIDAPENNVGTEGFDQKSADIEGLPGIAELRPYRLGFLDVGNRRVFALGYAPGVERKVGGAEYVNGDLAAVSAALPERGTVALSKSVAGQLNLELGQRFTLMTATGPQRVRYVATIRNYGWQGGAIALGGDDFAKFFGNDQVTMLGVAVKPGANIRQVQKTIAANLHGPARMRVETRSEGEARGNQNVRMGLTRLGQIEIAVVIGALFALTTGFAAAVSRRVRQYGYLRASGLSTSQLCGAIATEAGLIMLIGGTVGVIGGTIGQVMIASVFRSVGYPVVFAVSAAPLLAALVVAALIAGVVVLSSLRLAAGQSVMAGLEAE